MMGDMPKTDTDTERSGILRAAGLRATTQRIALLRALTNARQPRSVEELVRDARGAFDVATAYRTLEAFREAGLARRIDLVQGRALFEAAGAHHHHAICVSCGRIEDVEACLPKGLDASAKNASGFARIDEHMLEFFGMCKACARAV